MAVFENCSVVLDLKKIPYKEKKKLMSAIVDNGGSIHYVINQKCSFVVTNSLEDLSSSRQRSVQKHQVPVVGLQFVWSCVEAGRLLPVKEHILTPQSSEITQQSEVKFKDQLQLQKAGLHREIQKKSTEPSQRRFYKESDRDLPEFPPLFQVAKYSIFYKAEAKTWSAVELQSARGEQGHQFCVVNSVMREVEKTVFKEKLMFTSSSEEAVEVYLMLREELVTKGFKQTQTLPPEAQKLASSGLQQLLLEEQLNCSSVSQEVGSFVELIWTEALGSLNSILTVPVTSISLNDVSRVEGLLLQVQKRQDEDEVKALLEEVNTLLPLRITEPDSKQKLVSQKLDLCQLIRDILSMTEATLGNPSPSSLGKYRALRCSIEQVASQSPEFQSVCQLLHDRPVQVQQILRVRRGAELHMFKEELGNIKPLLHSSGASSFVGILSRGLLLPKVGVEQHGIRRTDVGNLGSGIYFSDSLSTSVKYSKPSETDGSRLLLVSEVALGQCKDLHRRDTTLTDAPDGYNSVHAVRRSQKTHSDFEDDEYVVYNTDQIRLKYVVQFTLQEDQMKTFQPHVDTSEQISHSVTPADLLSSDESLEVVKNPLDEVTAGLLDSSGQTLPLQAVHVRCKLMDLLCQVIIFQTYTNKSDVPIEAKYVFPLEETATVCGFEAFINGKHVIGKVKEKEQARKEYKQAIEKGHGAYLMDQDAPDVFTISVGNLPPGATVLIKVIFITELVVRAGSVIFSLPASVAPWQQSSALNQRTQTTVEKVCVNELQPEGEFSLSMSIDMPYEIKDLDCSHRFKIKKTDCKAVISTLPEQTLSSDGFQLSFTLSQIHMPRMWVEKHPEKDTEACMLVFYPDFESGDVSGEDDVIILMDTSESMRGESVLNTRRLALKLLNSLERSLRVNIISFGTDYREAFPSPKVLDEVFEEAKKFIMSSVPVGGSTELWRPLRSLNLLPPSRGVRNVLLISDGHVQNQPQTLQLVRENAHHTRIFTCGLSSTANRHMLRALAQAGRGAYEFFDTKKKHTWTEKVKAQVKCMASSCCSSVAVKWQQFSPSAPPPVQAPSQLHALFSERHTLVYGFVPHCTQATLLGDLSGLEMKKVVSTTELQKTKGTFLHKLTARAIIRDFEDGSLGSDEAEHEGKKAELKSYIIELSKEFSILSQFTSFVAIEERDQDQPDSGFTDVPKIIAEEDVDILPYMGWTEDKESLDLMEDLAASSVCEMEFASSPEVECDEAYSAAMSKMRILEAKLKKTSRTKKFSHACYFIGGPDSFSAPSPDVECEEDDYEDVTQRNTLKSDFSDICCYYEPSPVQKVAYKYESMEKKRPVPQRLQESSALKRSEALISLPPPASGPPQPCSFSHPPPLPPSQPASALGFSFSQHSASDSTPESAPQAPPSFRRSCAGFSAPAFTAKFAEDTDVRFGSSHQSRLSLPGHHPPPPPPAPKPIPPPVSDCATPDTRASFHHAVGRSAFPPSPQARDSHPAVIQLLARRKSRKNMELWKYDLAEPAVVPAALSSAPAPEIRRQEVIRNYEDDRNVRSYERMSCLLSRKPPVRSFMSASRRATQSCTNGFEIQEERVQRKCRRRRLRGINWEELFDLQHEDGYWECTGSLSRFLGLDVDFFANVFLKEKGIFSLGVKARADILRLVATMLVLQLMRVKMVEVELFKSLFRLIDSPEPRPACYESVKKAVGWVCWADRQYPCVYSRLEFGWNWESSTRQLLGLDSLPLCSPLTIILQRSSQIPVM